MKTLSIPAFMFVIADLAQAGSFTPVGGLPGSAGVIPDRVSGDGSFVVGSVMIPELGVRHAVRWSAHHGGEDLGALPGAMNTTSSNVNRDGSVVVGYSNRAFRWTQLTGMQPLLSTDLYTQAYGVSADGAVVVGVIDSDAYRWTSSGYETLGRLPGAYRAAAWAVSGDGNVVAGTSYGGGDRPFIWTRSTGLVGIGSLGTGYPATYAIDISADGTSIVGYGFDISNSRAFRWTTGTGLVDLGSLPGAGQAYANATNGDGSIVVGTCWQSFGEAQFTATMWSSSLGTVDLNAYLPTLGIDLDGWVLTHANDVSDDGLTIVGYGVHNGLTEGWIAYLGCKADFNKDGTVDLFDYIDFVDAFAQNDPISDFNADGVIDFFDYLDFLMPFSQGC